MRSRVFGVVVLLLACSVVGAQEPADHPVVGRYGESVSWYQEVSRYGEYEIALDEAETQTVTGEVWMTLYDAPADSSTFSVYSTYLGYLEENGFEILYSCKPGECPSDFLEDAYHRTSFADLGNYSHPAPFTNGSDEQAAYISARRGDDVYVGIAIAAGWEAFPQYKLDVVEIGENTQRITVQDPGSGSDEVADHPIIGRFNRSRIVHQEISRFGEYEIAVGDEQTRKVEGEVWMALYDAPDDSSTFSVYATYLSFLEAEGFEILVDCKPRECGGGLLGDVYERAAFADHGNYAHPAPFTNGNGDHSAYIAARRGDSLYASIAIAAGWSAHPQYKLDVVEVGSNTGGIASVGTPAQPETEAESDEGPAPREATAASDSSLPGRRAAKGTGFFTGNGPLEARGGLTGYLPMDPAIAGGLVATERPLSLPEVQAAGLKNVYGPYGRVTWFPNESTGLAVEAAYLQADEAFTPGDDTTYRSQAELQLFQAAAVVRMVGSEYPATITMAFGGGAAIVALAQSASGGSSPNYYYSVEDVLGVVSTSIDLSIPILRFAHVTGGMAYLFIPFTTLTLEDDDGTYARTYHEGNLGGLSLRMGVVIEL